MTKPLSSTVIQDRLIAKIRELAQKYPNALYKKGWELAVCSYDKGTVVNGPKTCGCIVGQGLRRVSQKRFKETAEKESTSTSYQVLKNILNLPINTNKANWIRRVQSNQDFGKTWGQAVKDACEAYPSV